MIPQSLFAFSLLYGGMTCIAGVLGNKQVALGGSLAVEAGIFPFLLLVVLSSAVAELHGRETANRLVRFGFIPLVASMGLILLALALPPASDMDPARHAAFQQILGQSPRLMLAGIIAYGISQTLNVSIFSRLQRRTGNLLWLRAATAGVLSQIVDTLLFITIAFYGEFPIASLLLGQIIAKILLSALIVPVLILLAVRIGRWIDRA